VHGLPSEEAAAALAENARRAFGPLSTNLLQ
jgi:hypothetical protein